MDEMNQQYQQQEPEMDESADEDKAEEGDVEDEEDDDEVFLPTNAMKKLKGHRKEVPSQIIRK